MTTIKLADPVFSPSIIGASVDVGVVLPIIGDSKVGTFTITNMSTDGLTATLDSLDFPPISLLTSDPIKYAELLVDATESAAQLAELSTMLAANNTAKSLNLPEPFNLHIELNLECGATFSTPDHPNLAATNYANPDPSAGPQYTYNKVDQSISGHVREVDDTPGRERLRESHRSGTNYEIRSDGSKVTKIVGDNYDIYLHDDHVYVQGSCHITVIGDANIVANNMNLTVAKTFNLRATDINIQAENGITMFSAGSAAGNINIKSLKDINVESQQKTLIYSKDTISINSDNAILQVSKDKFDIASGAAISIVATDNISIGAGADIITSAGANLIIGSGSAASLSAGSTLDLGGAGITTLASGADIQINAGGITFVNGSEVQLGVGGGSVPSAPAAPEAAKVPYITPIPPPGPTALIVIDDSDIASVGGVNALALSAGHTQALNDDEDNTVSQGTSQNGVNVGAPIKAAEPDPAHTANLPPELKSNPETKPENTTPHVGTFAYTDTGNKTDPNDWAGVNYDSIVLSPSFKLSNLTTKPLEEHGVKLIAQNGKTKNQMADNLQALCVNILEPLKIKFPGFRINSAFRPGTGSSQHKIGQAADLTFPDKTNGECLEIAKWCLENLPVDQVILEHSNLTTWIHVSHNSSGKQRKMALTWKQGCKIGTGGKEYASGFACLKPATALSTIHKPGEILFT